MPLRPRDWFKAQAAAGASRRDYDVLSTKFFMELINDPTFFRMPVEEQLSLFDELDQAKNDLPNDGVVQSFWNAALGSLTKTLPEGAFAGSKLVEGLAERVAGTDIPGPQNLIDAYGGAIYKALGGNEYQPQTTGEKLASYPVRAGAGILKTIPYLAAAGAALPASPIAAAAAGFGGAAAVEGLSEPERPLADVAKDTAIQSVLGAAFGGVGKLGEVAKWMTPVKETALQAGVGAGGSLLNTQVLNPETPAEDAWIDALMQAGLPLAFHGLGFPTASGARLAREARAAEAKNVQPPKEPAAPGISDPTVTIKDAGEPEVTGTEATPETPPTKVRPDDDIVPPEARPWLDRWFSRAEVAQMEGLNPAELEILKSKVGGQEYEAHVNRLRQTPPRPDQNSDEYFMERMIADFESGNLPAESVNGLRLWATAARAAYEEAGGPALSPEAHASKSTPAAFRDGATSILWRALTGWGGNRGAIDALETLSGGPEKLLEYGGIAKRLASLQADKLNPSKADRKIILQNPEEVRRLAGEQLQELLAGRRPTHVRAGKPWFTTAPIKAKDPALAAIISEDLQSIGSGKGVYVEGTRNWREAGRQLASAGRTAGANVPGLSVKTNMLMAELAMRGLRALGAKEARWEDVGFAPGEDLAPNAFRGLAPRIGGGELSHEQLKDYVSRLSEARRRFYENAADPEGNLLAGAFINLEDAGQIDMPGYAKRVIGVFSNANAGTVRHELAHMFYDLLPPEGKSIYNGAVGLAAAATPGNKEHEIFADMTRLFMETGEAPIPRLKPVFKRFQDWAKINAEAFIGDPELQSKLTPEVRGFLWRMFNAPEAFRQWVGDSQAYEVYHGSGNVLRGDAFDPAIRGSATGAPSARLGFFFSKNPETAKSYLGFSTEEHSFAEALGISIPTIEYTYDYLSGLEHDLSRTFLRVWKQDISRIIEYIQKIELGEDAVAPLDSIRSFRRAFDSYANKVKSSGLNAIDYGVTLIEKRILPALKKIERGTKKPPQPLGVHRFMVKMKNPLIHDQRGAEYRDESYYDIISRARAAGHDGVIIRNTYDGGPLDDIYVVFDEHQIKSAQANKGTFTKYSPSIYYDRATARPEVKSSTVVEPKTERWEAAPVGVSASGAINKLDVVGRKQTHQLRRNVELGEQGRYESFRTKDGRTWFRVPGGPLAFTEPAAAGRALHQHLADSAQKAPLTMQDVQSTVARYVSLFTASHSRRERSGWNPKLLLDSLESLPKLSIDGQPVDLAGLLKTGQLVDVRLDPTSGRWVTALKEHTSKAVQAIGVTAERFSATMARLANTWWRPLKRVMAGRYGQELLIADDRLTNTFQLKFKPLLDELNDILAGKKGVPWLPGRKGGLSTDEARSLVHHIMTEVAPTDPKLKTAYEAIRTKLLKPAIDAEAKIEGVEPVVIRARYLHDLIQRLPGRHGKSIIRELRAGESSDELMAHAERIAKFVLTERKRVKPTEAEYNELLDSFRAVGINAANISDAQVGIIFQDIAHKLAMHQANEAEGYRFQKAIQTIKLRETDPRRLEELDAYAAMVNGGGLGGGYLYADIPGLPGFHKTTVLGALLGRSLLAQSLQGLAQVAKLPLRDVAAGFGGMLAQIGKAAKGKGKFDPAGVTAGGIVSHAGPRAVLDRIEAYHPFGQLEKTVRIWGEKATTSYARRLGRAAAKGDLLAIREIQETIGAQQRSLETVIRWATDQIPPGKIMEDTGLPYEVFQFVARGTREVALPYEAQARPSGWTKSEVGKLMTGMQHFSFAQFYYLKDQIWGDLQKAFRAFHTEGNTTLARQYATRAAGRAVKVAVVGPAVGTLINTIWKAATGQWDKSIAKQLADMDDDTKSDARQALELYGRAMLDAGYMGIAADLMNSAYKLAKGERNEYARDSLGFNLAKLQDAVKYLNDLGTQTSRLAQGQRGAATTLGKQTLRFGESLVPALKVVEMPRSWGGQGLTDITDPDVAQDRYRKAISAARQSGNQPETRRLLAGYGRWLTDQSRSTTDPRRRAQYRNALRRLTSRRPRGRITTEE